MLGHLSVYSELDGIQSINSLPTTMCFCDFLLLLWYFTGFHFSLILTHLGVIFHLQNIKFSKTNIQVLHFVDSIVYNISTITITGLLFLITYLLNIFIGRNLTVSFGPLTNLSQPRLAHWFTGSSLHYFIFTFSQSQGHDSCMTLVKLNFTLFLCFAIILDKCSNPSRNFQKNYLAVNE